MATKKIAVLVIALAVLLIYSLNAFAHVSPAGTFKVNKGYIITFVAEPKQAIVGTEIVFYVQVDKVTPLYSPLVDNPVPYVSSGEFIELAYRPTPDFFYEYQKFHDVNTVWSQIFRPPTPTLPEEIPEQVYVEAILAAPSSNERPLTYYTAGKIAPGMYKFTHIFEEKGFHEIAINVYDPSSPGEEPTKIFNEFTIIVEKEGPSKLFWGFMLISLVGTFGAVLNEKFRGKKV